MENFKIYLSGSMSSVSWEEQTRWRQQVQDAILYEDHDLNKKVYFFDPTQYYNFKEERHKSEREIMEYDLYNVRTSDIVIVNFNDPNSLGTAMELVLAKELRIPVVGINKENKKLHPWLTECCTRMCDSLREAVDYVVEFYLN